MIRVLTAEDNSQKEAAWSLFEEVYPDFESRVPFYSEYKEKVLSKALILYGEVDGSIKGVIAFYCNDSGSRTAYITQIALKEASRRLGIGGILLGKCEEISLQKGMRYLRLEVWRRHH